MNSSSCYLSRRHSKPWPCCVRIGCPSRQRRGSHRLLGKAELDAVDICRLPVAQDVSGSASAARGRQLRGQKEPRARSWEERIALPSPSLGRRCRSLSGPPGTPWNRYAEMRHTELLFSDCSCLLLGTCCGEKQLFPLPFPGWV